jgi:hypothetical protein
MTNKKAPAETGALRSFSAAELLQRPEPVIDIPVNLVLGKAVALLQLAFELLAAAPSITLRSSSVSLPHFSLALPLNCFQLPSTRFQSICHLHFALMAIQRTGNSNVPSALPAKPDTGRAQGSRSRIFADFRINFAAALER